MPRLLILSPEFPPHSTGGLGTHLVALTSGLSARGWTIDVILPAARRIGIGAWPDAEPPFEGHGARVHLVPPSDATRAMHPSSRRGGQSYTEDLRQYVLRVSRDERGPVDLMHVHDWHLWKVAETRCVEMTLAMTYLPFDTCAFTSSASSVSVASS